METGEAQEKNRAAHAVPLILRRFRPSFFGASDLWIIKTCEDGRRRIDEQKCDLCGKSFDSLKALHGHMRSHSDRTWRGMRPRHRTKRPSPSKVKPVTGGADGGVTSRRRGYRKGGIFSSEDYEVAEILLLLKDYEPAKKSQKKIADEESKKQRLKKQALGVHMFLHKQERTRSPRLRRSSQAGKALFDCPVIASPSSDCSAATQAVVVSKVRHDFDLNELPELEEA